MKELITKKLYYRKYDHRVVVTCRRTSYAGKSKKLLALPCESVVMEFAIQELGGKDNFRSRCEYVWRQKSGGSVSNVTLYFRDSSFFDALSQRYASSIAIVERPLNSEHTEALSKDRVITRKSLFRNKYRYCIRTEAVYNTGSWRFSNEHIKNMIEWHSKTFPNLVRNQDYMIYEGWNKANFFFANAADAMLMKLTWGEHISSTDRIMLLDEIPSSQTT